MITEFVGPRCLICEEGIAVLIRMNNIWDWACLRCAFSLREPGDIFGVNIHAKRGSLDGNASSWENETWSTAPALASLSLDSSSDATEQAVSDEEAAIDDWILIDDGHMYIH